jgi:hypothetical protein
MPGISGKPVNINRVSSFSQKPMKTALPERNRLLLLIVHSSRQGDRLDRIKPASNVKQFTRFRFEMLTGQRLDRSCLDFAS